MNSAIFLDRDGVIVENRASYIRSWEDVSFYPQALDALSRVKPSPFKIFIVTNQSAVGRGLISLQEANDINHKVILKIEQAGGRIDEAFICPHAPEDGCECRKPRPGLFIQAQKRYGLNFESSMMIGDAFSDIFAGRNAGVGRNIMVRTGRGLSQLAQNDIDQTREIEIFDDIAQVFSQLFRHEAWWIR